MPTSATTDRRDARGWRVGLTVLGLALLLGWAVVWGVSVRRDGLAGGGRTWLRDTPVWHFLGLDFLSNYHAARHWLAGGNPYVEPFGDPLGRPICYPPVILYLFAWCHWLGPRAAVRTWMAALTALACLGAVAAWRARRRLGLGDVPLPFVLAAVLGSTPVLFALERGNWDLLVVLPLVLAGWALRQPRPLGGDAQRLGVPRRAPSWSRDVLAGSCLALAAWIKLYPALLVVSLVVFRRHRALLVCAVVGAGFGLAGLPYLSQVYANIGAVLKANTPAGVYPTVHTISGCWKPLWQDTRLHFLTCVPATLAALGLVLPVVGWVSYRLYRCRDAGPLALPYLLWLASVATLLPKSANDYNFVFLPLAALAVWDRRDPLVVHLLMAFLLLWWQPLMLSVGPKLLFAFKMGGVAAVTLSLLGRVAEARARQGGTESPAGETTPPVPLAA